VNTMSISEMERLSELSCAMKEDDWKRFCAVDVTELNLNTPDSNDWTPLQRAADFGRPHMVKYLIQRGALVNLPDKDGMTPVYLASHNGDTDTVRALGALHADVNKASNNGCTPVYVASGEGHTDTVRALAALHADVNKASNNGVTPLHTASYCGRMAVVKFLVEKCRVAIHTTAYDGTTPISDAKREDIAQYLEQQMMKVLTESNMLPFCTDVLNMVVTYLQWLSSNTKYGETHRW